MHVVNKQRLLVPSNIDLHQFVYIVLILSATLILHYNVTHYTRTYTSKTIYDTVEANRHVDSSCKSRKYIDDTPTTSHSGYVWR